MAIEGEFVLFASLKGRELVVVVLNYVNYWDTFECVESLLRQQLHTEIVVVENGSPNESLVMLRQRFKGCLNIHILTSETNLGFARGFNLGIRYARETLGGGPVLILNSDTVLTTDEIVGQLVGQCQADSVGIVSPTVTDIEGGAHPLASMSADRLTWGTLRAVLLTCLDALPTQLRHRLLATTGVVRKRVRPTEEAAWPSDVYHPSAKAQFALHGPAFVLTEAFFARFRGMYPRTFLYCEEINLFWYLRKARLATAVASTDPVMHKTARSTTAVLGDRPVTRKARLALFSFVHSFPMYSSSLARVQRLYDSEV